MKYVGTIRDKAKIREITREAARMGPMPHMMTLLGFNTGFRVSDLLPLRVRDIRADFLVRQEQKTGKYQEVKLNPSVKAELMRMTARMNEDDLLFPSPQLTKRGQPVDYVTAYRWINKACRRAGVRGSIGCHTMRKTFGYHFYYESGGDVAMLMKRFNHSSESVTLRYIGIEQDRQNKVTDKMRLG